MNRFRCNFETIQNYKILGCFALVKVVDSFPWSNNWTYSKQLFENQGQLKACFHMIAAIATKKNKIKIRAIVATKWFPYWLISMWLLWSLRSLKSGFGMTAMIAERFFQQLQRSYMYGNQLWLFLLLYIVQHVWLNYLLISIQHPYIL